MSKKSAEHPAIEKVLLLMVSGLSHADLTAACIGKLEVATEEVAGIIAKARRKLTLAADYNRDEQIGTAVTRLNDIYARAIRAQDSKTALQAQRELNRMMDLYAQPNRGDGEEAGKPSPQLDLIAGHLCPLGLADQDYPIEEHARLAAELIRRNGLTKP